MASILETARLSLRPATRDDAAFIRDLMNEPAYIRNIGDRGIRTNADAETYIEAKFIESYNTLGFGLWIVETKADMKAIGICGYVKRDALDYPDLGFAFLERFRSQGYGFEAATAVLRYGSECLGFSEVLGITSKDNRASIRLLEKLGFRYNGTILLPGFDGERLLFALTLQRPRRPASQDQSSHRH